MSCFNGFGMSLGNLSLSLAFPGLVITLMLMSITAQGDDIPWIHPKCSPLPFAEASQIAVLQNGDIARIHEGSFQTSSDDGRKWSTVAPVMLKDAPSFKSAYLVAAKSGTLVLAYADYEHMKWGWNSAAGEPNDDISLDVWTARSTDGGKNWTDVQCVLKGYDGGPMDVKQLSDGRLVIVLQDMMRKPGRHVSFTAVSDNDGKTWRRGNIIDLGGHGHHDGALEGTTAELSTKRVLMLLRTTLGEFWSAYSDNNGLYWRELRPSGIPASSAPGFLCRLASGRLALVWNQPESDPSKSRMGGTGDYSENRVSWDRAELSIAFSDDDARSWSAPVVIARQPDAWLSYPYVVERRPGEIWVVTRFTQNTKTGKPLNPICISLREKDFIRKSRLKLIKH